MKPARFLFLLALITAAGLAFYAKGLWDERKTLRLVIGRLNADSRIAEAVVTDSRPDPRGGPALTTIKFVEYDTASRPLPPKYFTFSGNMIQFQSLVVRFDEALVGRGHPFKGKSAYVFLKAFTLQPKPEVFEINPAGEVPGGYEVPGSLWYQKKLWRGFWKFALDGAAARRERVKNAQIEAPGTLFVPGLLYTIKIEHDGGMRIDAKDIPPVLKDERTAR